MQTDSRQELAISLFPFLSILSCVIGVLVLLVTVMSIGHVANQPEDPNIDDYAVSYVELEFELERLRDQQTEIESLIAEADAVARRVEELRAVLAELEVSEDGLTSAERKVIEEIERRDGLLRQINAVQARLQELTALIESKRQQRQMMPQERSVRIVGAGNLVEGAFGLDSRSKSSPTFIECSGEALIVHPSGTRIRKSAIAGGRTFAEVLNTVNATDGGILIFLIREDGVKVFDTAHTATRNRGVRYGFLPIPGDGPIDLSHFSI